MKNISKAKSITNRDDEMLALYLKDINRIPLLEEDEELDLYPLVKEGDEAAINKLINANLRFVVTIAKQYQGQGIELMDLISEGNKGLVIGARKFDPDKNTKFLTYVGWWIRQSIIHALNSNSRTVRIPNNTLANINKFHQINEFYQKTFGRDVTIDELIDLTGLSRDTIVTALTSKKKVLSFDMPFEKNTEDAGCLLDVIPNNEQDPEEELMNKEYYKYIEDELQYLPLREATIIKMYFGLYTKSMNLDEIGNKMGLTAERVRQLRDAGLEMIRERLLRYE